MRRKSQIHMLETIAVLAVFIILVVLGFVFYTRMYRSGIEEEKEETIELSAIKIAQRAATLPELQCSENNVVRDNCIDGLKLDAIINLDLMNTNELYYFDKLSFSVITIQQIYPDYEDCEIGQCKVIYERPSYDYTNKMVTNIPISIFDPINNKNAFGVMTVESYLK